MSPNRVVGNMIPVHGFPELPSIWIGAWRNASVSPGRLWCYSPLIRVLRLYCGRRGQQPRTGIGICQCAPGTAGMAGTKRRG